MVGEQKSQFHRPQFRQKRADSAAPGPITPRGFHNFGEKGASHKG